MSQQWKPICKVADIPVLGAPFRHTVTGESKSELMIFLTPYIVENAGQYKDVTLDEANRADLTQNAFSPADIMAN